MSPTNAQRPVLFRGAVDRTNNQAPIPKIAVSIRNVAATEFHSPRPTLGPSSKSGRSGRWVKKSSTRWLTTSAATTPASRGDRLASHTPPKATRDQTRLMTRLWDQG